MDTNFIIYFSCISQFHFVWHKTQTGVRFRDKIHARGIPIEGFSATETQFENENLLFNEMVQISLTIVVFRRKNFLFFFNFPFSFYFQNLLWIKIILNFLLFIFKIFLKTLYLSACLFRTIIKRGSLACVLRTLEILFFSRETFFCVI